MSRNRMVQSPVLCVMYSTGLGPSSGAMPLVTSFKKGQSSNRNGTRQAANNTIFVQRLPRIFPKSVLKTDLVVLAKIHARVEAGHLAVPVEHQSVTHAEFGQTAFLGLAPARVIHVRIDV